MKRRTPFGGAIYLMHAFLVGLLLLGSVNSAAAMLDDESDSAVLRAKGAEPRPAMQSAATPVLPAAQAGHTAEPAVVQTSGGAEPATAQEADAGPLTRFVNRLGKVWNSPTYDLYVPIYTWHNRLMYDADKAASYNENPWGLGFGRSMFDEDGDWHALYVMGFMDSFDKFEPIVGYGYLHNWYFGGNKDWRFGLGYTLGITARENYDYIPMPLPLPMFGLEYKKVGVQAVYIPGTYGNGNVLFGWLHWELPQ